MRYFRLILVCVLLGAATTTAVAWGTDALGHAEFEVRQAPDGPAGAYLGGVPMRAMRVDTGPVFMSGPVFVPDHTPSGLRYLHHARPVTLGFSIDTAFYGTIWFAMIAGPAIVRRRTRERRGLCPSCGYDMRGSDAVCPECGT